MGMTQRNSPVRNTNISLCQMCSITCSEPLTGFLVLHYTYKYVAKDHRLFAETDLAKQKIGKKRTWRTRDYAGRRKISLKTIISMLKGNRENVASMEQDKRQ